MIARDVVVQMGQQEAVPCLALAACKDLPKLRTTSSLAQLESKIKALLIWSAKRSSTSSDQRVSTSSQQAPTHVRGPLNPRLKVKLSSARNACSDTSWSAQPRIDLKLSVRLGSGCVRRAGSAAETTVLPRSSPCTERQCVAKAQTSLHSKAKIHALMQLEPRDEFKRGDPHGFKWWRSIKRHISTDRSSSPCWEASSGLTRNAAKA